MREVFCIPFSFFVTLQGHGRTLCIKVVGEEQGRQNIKVQHDMILTTARLPRAPLRRRTIAVSGRADELQPRNGLVPVRGGPQQRCPATTILRLDLDVPLLLNMLYDRGVLHLQSHFDMVFGRHFLSPFPR